MIVRQLTPSLHQHLSIFVNVYLIDDILGLKLSLNAYSDYIYQKRFQLWPMSRFNFNGFITCNNFSFQALHNNDKPQQVTAARQGMFKDDDEVEPLYNPSLENLTNCYQISFQHDFMAQHALVFKREIQNYMEFVRIYLSDRQQKILKRFPQGLYNMNTNMTCQELMMMTETQMADDVKQSFIEQLKYYDKLMQFLNIVADYCPSQIAVELIHISQQILEEFMQSKYKDDNLVESSILLSLASSKANKLIGIKMLNLSILDESSSQLMGKYQKFIEIYCATTILLIAQYFENPFNGQSGLNDLKRTLSPFYLEDDDEESNQSNSLRKLRKYSY